MGEPIKVIKRTCDEPMARSKGMLPCDKNCKDKQIYNKLKHYEDLEEQGRLVILQKPIGRVTFDQFNREGGTNDTSTND